MTSEQEWVLVSGDLYQVGPNDRHLYEVLEDEHHLSIFYPSLRGDETHDEDGAYSASGPVPVTEQRMFVRHIEQMREAGGEMLDLNRQERHYNQPNTRIEPGLVAGNKDLTSQALNLISKIRE